MEDHNENGFNKNNHNHNEDKRKGHVSIHWFRNCLRLHDNPALLAALENAQEIYPLFIIDEEINDLNLAAYPRIHFLWECLDDLHKNLKRQGSRLYVLQGKSVDVLANLIEEWGITRLTFEADPEPIYQERDNSVKILCEKKDVDWSESCSRLLWEPHTILEENGGEPPLTYDVFCQVSAVLGLPSRPSENPDFSDIKSPQLQDKYLLPALEQFAIYPENSKQAHPQGRYMGGETKALMLLNARLEKEKMAFECGKYHPNQSNPNLNGMPMSLSPHIRFGTVSIRRFYWAQRDSFSKLFPGAHIPYSITSQLIWREYFYCMSVNNPTYDKMENNPICLDIEWYDDDSKFQKWKKGETGFPWIDACMRQLNQEGWIHQVCRHAVACFLTRGDLWLNWQRGFEVFQRYLIDYDWSINAGNWMWVSSSAFEKVLQCPKCICPVRYGRRIDPSGDYVRRFCPELKDMPLQYLFDPWKAPLKVQEEANCIVGKDYPSPMVNHVEASKDCIQKMEMVKSVSKDKPHIAPTNEAEVMELMWCKTPGEEKVDWCNHELCHLEID